VASRLFLEIPFLISFEKRVRHTGTHSHSHTHIHTVSVVHAHALNLPYSLAGFGLSPDSTNRSHLHFHLINDEADTINPPLDACIHTHTPTSMHASAAASNRPHMHR
jgi:hypothetical protein